MPTHIPTDDEIRLRAYHLWEINGRQDGRELEYWLQAALELEDAANPPPVGSLVPPPAAVAANLDRPSPARNLRRTA